MNPTACNDKVFLITGGTSGVGRASAEGLARLGGQVVLLVRSAERGRAVLADIARRTGNPRGELVVGDLERVGSVHRAADEIRGRFARLDGLLNLAGVLSFTKRTTAEGLDSMFATNYLGPFALTTALRDRLGDGSRVLMVAGRPGFLRRPRVDFDDLQFDRRYRAMTALTQTLYARVAFAFELARRLAGTGATSVAFHPGAVRGSQLGHDAPWWLRVLGAAVVRFGHDDCRIAEHLATAPDVAGATGVFYDDRGRVVPVPDDPAQGQRLWAISEALVADRAGA